NHSGDRASFTRVRVVANSTPDSSSATATAVHRARTATTGLNSRTIRPRSQWWYGTPRARAEASERVATWPPTRKNTARVWNTQETGASQGRCCSGLAVRSVRPSPTRAVTSQWPRTTPSPAKARRASTARSRWAGVAASMRAAGPVRLVGPVGAVEVLRAVGSRMGRTASCLGVPLAGARPLEHPRAGVAQHDAGEVGQGRGAGREVVAVAAVARRED